MEGLDNLNFQDGLDESELLLLENSEVKDQLTQLETQDMIDRFPGIEESVGEQVLDSIRNESISELRQSDQFNGLFKLNLKLLGYYEGDIDTGNVEDFDKFLGIFILNNIDSTEQYEVLGEKFVELKLNSRDLLKYKEMFENKDIFANNTASILSETGFVLNRENSNYRELKEFFENQESNFQLFSCQIFGAFEGTYNSTIDNIFGSGTQNVLYQFYQSNKFDIYLNSDKSRLDFDLSNGFDLQDYKILESFLPASVEDIKNHDLFKGNMDAITKQLEDFIYSDGINSEQKLFEKINSLPEDDKLVIIALVQIYGTINGNYRYDIDGKFFGNGTQKVLHEFINENFLKFTFNGRIDFSDGISREEFENNYEDLISLRRQNIENSQIFESAEQFNDSMLNTMNMLGSDLKTIDEFFAGDSLEKFDKIRTYEAFVVQIYGIINGTYDSYLDGIYGPSTRTVIEKYIEDYGNLIETPDSGQQVNLPESQPSIPPENIPEKQDHLDVFEKAKSALENGFSVDEYIEYGEFLKSFSVVQLNSLFESLSVDCKSGIEESIKSFLEGIETKEQLDEKLLENDSYGIVLFQIYGNFDNPQIRKIDGNMNGFTLNTIKEFIKENEYDSSLFESERQSSELGVEEILKNGLTFEYFLENNDELFDLKLKYSDIIAIEGIEESVENYRSQLIEYISECGSDINIIIKTLKIDSHESRYATVLFQIYGSINDTYNSGIDGKYGQGTNRSVNDFFRENESVLDTIELNRKLIDYQKSLEGTVEIIPFDLTDGLSEAEYSVYGGFLKELDHNDLKVLFENIEDYESIYFGKLMEIMQGVNFDYNEFKRVARESSVDGKSYEATILQIYGVIIGEYKSKIDGVAGRGTNRTIQYFLNDNKLDINIFRTQSSQSESSEGTESIMFDFTINDGIGVNEYGILKDLVPISNIDILEKSSIFDGDYSGIENFVMQEVFRMGGNKEDILDNIKSDSLGGNLILMNLQILGVMNGDYSGNVDMKFGSGSEKILDNLIEKYSIELKLNELGASSRIDLSDGISEEEFKNNIDIFKEKFHSDDFREKEHLLQFVKPRMEEIKDQSDGDTEKMLAYFKEQGNDSYDIFLLQIYGSILKSYNGPINGDFGEESAMSNIINGLVIENFLRYGLDPKGISSYGFLRSNTGATLCARTARNDYESLSGGDFNVWGNAIDLYNNKDDYPGPRLVIEDLSNHLRDIVNSTGETVFHISVSKDQVGRGYQNHYSQGHSFVVFAGNDGNLYALDPYHGGDGNKPVLLENHRFFDSGNSNHMAAVFQPGYSERTA